MFESIDLLITKYNYKLNEICRALNVNKSSYLYWKSTGKVNKSKLASFYCDIISVYSDSNGIYGSPRIAAVLNNKGIITSTSKVAKAMHLLGIRSIVSKRFPHRKSNMTDNEKALIINLIKSLKLLKLIKFGLLISLILKLLMKGLFI